MAKQTNDGLTAFTARLRPAELAKLRAYITWLSIKQDNRRVSYSRAIAELLKMLPASELSPAALEKAKSKRSRAAPKRRTRTK